jgi:hypothetical protein
MVCAGITKRHSASYPAGNRAVFSMFSLSRKVSAMQVRFQLVLRSLAVLSLPLLSLCGLATTAHAQVTGVPLFFTNYYQQTGSATTTSNGSTFDARIFETNPGDVGGATLTYPDPASPGTYSPTTYSDITLDYGVNVATPADLQTPFPGFPFGTYTVDYSGGNAGSGSVGLDYTQNAFSSSIPMLTSATYNGLQGLDTTQAFTIGLTNDTPVQASTDNFIFIDIYNHNTGALADSQVFLSPSTTSEVLSANTLAPNTAYDIDLIFSDRITTNSNGVDTTLGFDQNTTTSFTTAPVPEASSVISFGLLLFLGSLGVSMRRRKALSAE